MSRTRIPLHWLVLVLVLSLVAAACGGDDVDVAEPDDADVDEPADTDDEPADDEPAEDEEPYENPSEGVYTDRIDYGLIYDITGPTTGTQGPNAEGFKAYIARVNAEGGVNGREINIIEEDERFEVPAGMEAYAKLVEDTPVLAITGLNNSSFQAAALPRLEEDGMPVVGAQATTEPAVNPYNPYFFATLASYADQADVGVAFAIQETGVAPEELDAVAISINVASGIEWGELIENRVEHLGGTYHGLFAIEPGQPDADAEAREIAEIDPDVIFMHGSIGTGIAALRSLELFGVTDTPIFAIFAQQVREIPLASTELAGNYWGLHSVSTVDMPVDIEVADQLIEDAENAGIDRDMYTSPDFSFGYANAIIVVEAIERAGNELNRETFMAALESLDGFETGGLFPPVTFGPDDRIGIESVRPSRFNLDEQAFIPADDYEVFADCINNYYITQSLEGWGPDCIGG